METLVLHIAFYYKEDRLEYIHKIIDESYNYLFSSVDIFIHTNEEFELKDCVNDSVRVNVIEILIVIVIVRCILRVVVRVRVLAIVSVRIR